MTREEAISVLKETIDPNVEKSFQEWKEWDKEKHLPAVNMAIEALQAEPVETLKQIPEACKNCSNHPSNGGSGICFCTLGSMKITC